MFLMFAARPQKTRRRLVQNLQVKPFALDYVVTCPSGCRGHQNKNNLINGDQMEMTQQTAGACFNVW